MDGVTIFWTVVGALVVLRVAYNLYNRHYGIAGRHHTHYWDSDFIPKGALWMRQGVWYTQPRYDRAVPRKFDERSNPLDIEPAVEIVTVPLQQRRVEREVEY